MDGFIINKLARMYHIYTVDILFTMCYPVSTPKRRCNVVTRMGSREARDNFTHLVGRAHYGGQVIIIERSGKPMAAVIPIDMYDRLVAEREARFEVLDHIRSRLPDVSPEKVAQDVAEAIAAVRASDAAGRT
jgi:prevent-host-death family protein